MLKSIVLGLAAVGFAVPVANAQTRPNLPDAIKPPAGQSIYLDTLAEGFQVYTCSKNDSGAFAWVLKAPDAQLFDLQKKPIGKHYAGPTWEGLDGGKVVGAAKANAPGTNAIPWLLLEVKSREGKGQFTEAKNILRVSTVGGVAPATGCDQAQSGKENRVPYTASYLFVK
jgi:uncharacterized protein DUF3455